MSETGGQWRTLEDFQGRLRQLLEDFPEDSHPDVYGVLGLVAGMAMQVRVPCSHCGRLTPADDSGTAQLIDFTAAAHRRRPDTGGPGERPVRPVP